MVAQPFDCTCRVPSLRDIDADRGEFWVSNPFAFSNSGENLSAYENNGVHLNAGGRQFYDLSFLSGADSPGDGRSVAACDIDGDGMLELFVRQAGGGSLLIFGNRLPKQNWLLVSLRGTESNTFGVGGKVLCEVAGRKIHRELYPLINFLSQAPPTVHLGLGDSHQVDRLSITWPSGKRQVLTDLEVNRHLLIREGSADFDVVVPGRGALRRPSAQATR